MNTYCTILTDVTYNGVTFPAGALLRVNVVKGDLLKVSTQLSDHRQKGWIPRVACTELPPEPKGMAATLLIAHPPENRANMAARETTFRGLLWNTDDLEAWIDTHPMRQQIDASTVMIEDEGYRLAITLEPMLSDGRKARPFRCVARYIGELSPQGEITPP